MASVSRFLTKKLRAKVNEAKSAVARSVSALLKACRIRV
jgi:hypothetical protein